MSETIYREFILRTPSMWSAVTEFVRTYAQACIDSDTPLRIIFTTEEKLRNKEQNKRYFGFLIKHVAAQSWVEGSDRRNRSNP